MTSAGGARCGLSKLPSMNSQSGRKRARWRKLVLIFNIQIILRFFKAISFIVNFAYVYVLEHSLFPRNSRSFINTPLFNLFNNCWLVFDDIYIIEDCCFFYYHSLLTTSPSCFLFLSLWRWRLFQFVDSNFPFRFRFPQFLDIKLLLFQMRLTLAEVAFVEMPIIFFCRAHKHILGVIGRTNFPVSTAYSDWVG